MAVGEQEDFATRNAFWIFRIENGMFRDPHCAKLLNLGNFKKAAFLSLWANGTLLITPVNLLEFVLTCMCMGHLIQ